MALPARYGVRSAACDWRNCGRPATEAIALPPKKKVKSGMSPPAMSTPILAGYSLWGTIVNCIVALSAVLTACQAGFCSNGVGGGNSPIVMALKVLPCPGASATDVLGLTG